ncbi:hypothetical protein B0T25DRAFT_296016 [Lasiosphaeria hispida]|uniref:Uncharacterized protein n=1 Tax=Lasiosphaeria hispida TaxID=260671 RepID=A0AAJ0HCT2_9PEZI|nr:hypothetical protein B0T25DRAFT_296016 [Lasiosphaeria hispida]
MDSTNPVDASGPASLPPGGASSTGITQDSRRKPTSSSFYDFHGTRYNKKIPGAQTWIYAREARQQQATVHPDLVLTGRGKYPSAFKNHDNELDLSTPGSAGPEGKTEWVHQPLIPGRVEAWLDIIPAGAVRSFYTCGNPGQFDVGYHDPLKSPTRNGSAKFSLATYHAAARTASDKQQQQNQ